MAVPARRMAANRLFLFASLFILCLSTGRLAFRHRATVPARVPRALPNRPRREVELARVTDFFTATEHPNSSSMTRFSDTAPSTRALITWSSLLSVLPTWRSSMNSDSGRCRCCACQWSKGSSV
eukprot:4639882-Pyramimonas_sp.AAC.1